MKSLPLLTATGPVLVLTSHESLHDAKLLGALKARGISKFVAFEVPHTLAKERYGGHFQVVENDLHETDDLRVLDFNGQRIFQLFRFDELGDADSAGTRLKFGKHVNATTSVLVISEHLLFAMS